MKIAAWLLSTCALTAQTVTVTGTVTNAITHAPVEGASVVLFSSGASSGAKTGASGGFSIPNVKAGNHRLVPAKEGFEGAAREIRIETGSVPPSFDLTMVPWPGLKGAVVDPERQPVARVRVRAISPGHAPGVVHEVTTDASGRYSFDRLDPAQYFILATPPSTGDAPGPVELAPTWFPGVSDQRDAARVSLTAGYDLSGSTSSSAPCPSSESWEECSTNAANRPPEQPWRRHCPRGRQQRALTEPSNYRALGRVTPPSAQPGSAEMCN